MNEYTVFYKFTDTWMPRPSSVMCTAKTETSAKRQVTTKFRSKDTEINILFVHQGDNLVRATQAYDLHEWKKIFGHIDS